MKLPRGELMSSPKVLGVLMLLACVAACTDSDDDEGRSSGQGGAPPASPSPTSMAVLGNPATLPPAVPSGFIVTPTTVSIAPTAIAFSPDGDTLYATSLSGLVLAYPVLADLLLGAPMPFLTGLGMPLGITATDNAVFVSVVQNNSGAVLRARDENSDGMAETVETLLEGLPIGRHNTNGLAIGPDGMLYVLNGSSSDSGIRDEGGPAETPPFTGSLLRLDPAASDLSPQADMVAATGFRNPFALSFVPAGHPSLPAGELFVTQNGPDGETYPQADGSDLTRPAGEDTLNRMAVEDSVVEHFGFPWCIYDRDQGGLMGVEQDLSEGSCHPLTTQAFRDIPGQAADAKPIALFGKHVSANGLDFNPGGNFPAEYEGDLFVAEFGSNPGSDFAGHKLVRVRFDESGEVMAVEDFLSLPAPLSLAFRPDGTLWIGDLSGLIVRVSALPGP